MARPEKPQDGALLRQLLYAASAVCLLGLTLNLVWHLLPWLQISVPLMLGWWLWHRFRLIQQCQQKTLNTIFYQLLQEHEGRVTVLDLALTAHLSAIAARHYLDDRAKDFFAHFEVSDRGDVVYVFPTLKSSPFPAVGQAAIAASNPDAPEPQFVYQPLACQPLTCQPLTQKELAKRLGVSIATLRRKKFASGLTTWTQSLDPEGIGWSYLAQSRRFFPLR